MTSDLRVGNTFHSWALPGLVPWLRLVAVALLVALMPPAVGAAAISLMIAATLVLMVLFAWDLRR